MPDKLAMTRHRDARDAVRRPLPTTDEQHAQADRDDERRARAAFVDKLGTSGGLPASYHLHGITFEVFPLGPVAACTIDFTSDEECYAIRVDVRLPTVTRYATTPRCAYRLDVLAGFKRGAADYCRGLIRTAEAAYRYAGADRADRWHAKRLGYALAQAEGEADANGRASPVIVGMCSRDYGLNLPAVYLETSRKVRPRRRLPAGSFLAGTVIRTASTDHSAGR